MSVNTNKYLDLAGLTLYDDSIKDWANSISQAGIKTVLKTADGNSLKFYKKPSATLSDTADFTIDLGSAEAGEKIAALATVLGATWHAPTTDPVAAGYYSIDLDSSLEATTIVGAINEVISDFNEFIGEIPSGASATTVIGYISEAINDAIDGLDVTEFPLAEVNSNVVTIHGISETNGEIAVGSNSANDIVLEEVAYTGAAADVSTTAITDGGATPETLYPAGTAQGTLEAIARNLNNLESDSVVTMRTVSSADYANVYELYQGDDGSYAAGNLIGAINIPKDMVVSAGIVVDVVFDDSDDTLHEGSISGADVTEEIKGAGGTATSADAGKYIKLTIANAAQSHLWIKATDLVDIYTGGTNSETSVDITNNVITVDIVDIAAGKITYIAAGTGTARESVGAALTRLDGDASTTGSVAQKINTAITALDTTNDVGVVSYVAGSGSGSAKTADTTTITGSVKETDGIIGTGTADSVAFQSIAGSEIAALFA